MEGTLIKESISDELILDLITINRVEIWKADNHLSSQPKYWTAIMFEVTDADFIQRLSEVLLEEWYVDLRTDEEKVLVFRNKIIRYDLSDDIGKQHAIEYCRSIGIPESQIDWDS